MLEKKPRMLSQDIAKGMAIMIVVLLHIVEGTHMVRTVLGLLFGYAMPFFIFMCGFNYKSKGLTPWQNIKKRMKQILIPYFLYTFLIGIVMTIHFVLNGEASIGQCIQSYVGFLLSRWGTPYVGWDLPKILFQRVYGPLWFIQFLIPATVVFYLFVDKALESKKKFFLIVFGLCSASAIMVALGWVLPWGLQDSPTFAAIMIVAAWCHQDDRLFKEPSKKKWTYINLGVGFAIYAVAELLFNQVGFVAAGEMSSVLGWPEAYITVLVAFYGSYFLIQLSKLIGTIPIVSTAFIWLGQHSLLILFLHLPVAHLVIDAFGYQQMMTEYPAEVEHISMDQVITLFVVLAILFVVITIIEKVQKARNKKAE